MICRVTFCVEVNVRPGFFDKQRIETRSIDGEWDSMLASVIECINGMMDTWRECEDQEEKKHIWNQIIRILPQSFLQKRTVMMSYAALRNIYRQREGHKLDEWKQFRAWVETLPEGWMITE